jgi:hypothetical protein
LQNKEVEANKPDRAQAVQNAEGINIGSTASVLRDSKVFVGQPTAEEVSRLTFGKLRDIRVHAQELRNQFARLLNRGSSLE